MSDRARRPDDNGRQDESIFFKDLADKPWEVAVFIGRYIIQFCLPVLIGSYDVIMGIVFMAIPTFSWKKFAGKSMRGLFEELKDDPTFIASLNERERGGNQRRTDEDVVGPDAEAVTLADDGINPLDKVILPEFTPIDDGTTKPKVLQASGDGVVEPVVPAQPEDAKDTTTEADTTVPKDDAAPINTAEGDEELFMSDEEKEKKLRFRAWAKFDDEYDNLTDD